MNFSRCRAYQKITDILILRKLLFSESIRDIVKVHGTLVISKSKIEVSSVSINNPGVFLGEEGMQSGQPLVNRGQLCEHKQSRSISGGGGYAVRSNARYFKIQNRGSRSVL